MTSPSTRLVEKRRQLFEVSEAFELQKRQSVSNDAHFLKKEEEIRERDTQLQHQLIRFNKFLQDNEAKRKRAEHRANEEVKEIAMKDRELRELEVKLLNIKSEKNKLSEEIAEISSYRNFLDSVVAAGATFPDIPALVARHATLTAANATLREQQEALDLANAQVRDEIVNYRKVSGAQISAAVNASAGLIAEAENAVKKRRAAEYEAEAVAAKDAQQAEILGEILRSIDNIFARVVAMRPVIQHGAFASVAADPTSDALAKLRALEAYVRDLREVADVAKRETKAATSAAKTASRSTPDLAEPEFVKVGGGHDPAGASSRVSDAGSRTGSRG